MSGRSRQSLVSHPRLLSKPPPPPDRVRADGRIRCPDQRTAKNGACIVPGCNHLAGTRQRVCRCCLNKVSFEFADRMSLVHKFNTHAEYERLENEALAKLGAHAARRGA